MTVSAPPRPPSEVRAAPNSKPLDRDEIEALVEALFEEARQEARRRHRRYWALAALLAFVGVVVLVLLDGDAASQTASPAVSARSSLAAGAANSKIAFIRVVPNRSAAPFVMNPDGTGQQRLSRDVDTLGLGGAPVWSPDGRKIALAAYEPGRKSDVYVMNADGSELQRLTRNPAGDGGPSWSPDGQKIAFSGYRNHGDQRDIFAMNADGSDQRSLTHSSVHEFDPAWSPDGQKIAFTRTRGRWGWSKRCTSSCADVWVMNADGSGQRRLTRNTSWGEGPVWSPDGRRIAFVRVRDWSSGLSDIYVIHADGTGQRKLTAGSGPVWSPDGRKIA